MRFLPFFIAALLAACSKSPKVSTEAMEANTPASQTLVHVERVGSLLDALHLAATAALTCQDSKQCPANVGMLLAADEAGGFDKGSDSVAACTAVLVGDDLALTNSHCIPSVVKLLPDLCADRVKLALPGNESLPAETLACAQLVGFSKRETPTSPDLALLRLARKTGRAAVIAALAGVEPDSLLRSYRVNPDLKHQTGVLVSDVCRAVAGSYRMPVYNSAADSVAVVGDCNAIPGNSGSPLVDGDGHLRALLQASLPLSSAAQALWSAHADEPFAPLAMGTSLRCLREDPAKGTFSWDDSCATIEDEDVAAVRPTIASLIDHEPIAQEVAGLLAPYLGQSTTPLARQVLTSSALDRRETLAPGCGLAAPVTLKVPVFSVSLRFNRYLQLAPARLAVESEAIQTFAPVACSELGD